ncbi:MAG TPA: serine protease [Polyangiaceae bacterium]|nr:serine protease [Polyangiaceae bacterium]
MLAYRAEVARATVLVLGESCTGFVAEAPDLVVTAAHCIPYPKRRVDVRGAAGQTLVARLDRIDRDTDLALLRLAVVLPVVPLRLSERVPAPGDRLMFVGRGDRGNKPQLARVEKLDRCPSLPRVPNAVFTSVAARPGDSGAPLVDANLRVVGLVHGGARCHIAAPVATLARQLAHEQRTILARPERSPGPWLPFDDPLFEGRWLTAPDSPGAELWWEHSQRAEVDGSTES